MSLSPNTVLHSPAALKTCSNAHLLRVNSASALLFALPESTIQHFERGSR